ncbi:MAG: MBL fold metallo-hydrolase [Methanopyri archaeon]|nr:MBL fold metallo-hydrolase [Methanopyri archaeon]
MRKLLEKDGLTVYKVGGKGVTPHPDCNCYLLEVEGEAVIVDVGASGGVLSNVPEDLKVEAALLTHAHYDHAAAGPNALDRGIPVAVHREEAEVLSEGDDVRSAATLFGASMPEYDPSFTFDEGDAVELADGAVEVKVLHTPGHSPGSCCFMVEDIVFTGDTVFEFGPGRWDLPGGDKALLRESVERLVSLEPEAAFPGHGREMIGNATEAMERVLRLL